jgi:hypothetical protein
MTRSLVGEVAVVGSEAEAAFTEAATGFTEGVPCMRDTAAAIGAASVRHIRSRAAPGVPLPVVPVVRGTQSLVVQVVR